MKYKANTVFIKSSLVSFLVFLLLFPFFTFGYTWVERTGAGSRGWVSVASSSDGAKLVAVADGGYVYTSTDYGATWTERTNSGQRAWRAVASSADGTKLVAVIGGDETGYVYTSSNSGQDWTAQTNSGDRSWKFVASSSDGAKLVAAAETGYIYTSTDGGVNWTERTTSGAREWVSVTSSSDGVKLAGAVFGGYVYTSTDSGATWTERTGSGSRNWYNISSSSDGAKLVAVVNNGYVYTSTDSGATWTERTAAGQLGWRSVASSSDGTRVLIAMEDDYLRLSVNSGVDWSQETNSGLRNWYDVALSDDGLKLVGVVLNGYIYTADASDSTAPTITSVSSDKANGSYTVGEVIDIDVTFSEAVTSTGNVTVTLETGTTDRTCTFSISNSATGTCNYTVQSGDTSSDLTVNTISGTIADQASNAMSDFVPATNLAANKAIVIDTTAPTLSETEPINQTFDTSPNYTFTTSEAGTITYGGSCGSVTTSAISGSNTITLSILSVGSYTNCTVTVTDTLGNASTPLSISTFSINAHSSVPLWALQEVNNPKKSFIDPNFGCTNTTHYSPLTGKRCSNVQFIEEPKVNCPILPDYPNILKLSSVNSTVKVLQQILNCKGYNLAVTGAGSAGNETTKFGFLTRKAVLLYQKDNQLKEDGVVGPLTRSKLNQKSGN